MRQEDAAPPFPLVGELDRVDATTQMKREQRSLRFGVGRAPTASTATKESLARMGAETVLEWLCAH